jgi:hypothetical protein
MRRATGAKTAELLRQVAQHGQVAFEEINTEIKGGFQWLYPLQ